MGSQGNRIFPFHLGDINLPTPANVVEAMNRAIADGKTGYCPGGRHSARFARRWPTTCRCDAASRTAP
jgi:bifunctional pyridoxal-dependent enzyme with beta-cystathionase and maltose regulon repressor activities